MAEKFGKQVKIYYTNNKQTTSVTGIDASSYILFNGGSNHIYTHGKDFAADPSHTHKFLELSDVKDTFSKPADTTNTWVPVDVNGKIYHREIPAAYNQDPSTLSVNSANTANIANTANSLSATCAVNDYIGIKGGESNDNGYLEIYTGDNGNEPIYLKQYSYDSSVAIHSATLLDSNGNTSFPGTISSNGHTVLTNRIDPIISVACTSSGILTFTSNNNNKYEFNFNHTHDLSQLTGKIKVECLPDAALKDTTYSYSVTQSATNNNANPYLTLTPSNSGTVSNIQLAGGSKVTITRDSASKIIISSSWRPLGTGSNDAAAGNHTHDSLVVDYADSTSFNAPYHDFQVLYAGGNNGIEGRPADVNAFGLLRFRVASGWSGQMLLANGGDLYIRSAADNAFNKSLPWKRIIDSENIKSQSVNYANSAGTATNATNADTAIKLKDYNGSTNIYCGYAGDGLTSDNIGYMVGIQVNGNNIYYKDVNKSELLKWLGFNASDFVKAFSTSNNNIDSDWGQSFKTFDPIPSGTPPEQNSNISLLSIGENFNRRKQLAFIYNNDNIYYRRHLDGGFTNWRRIAFVDSNVASATKLQTQRTIWGQSFDGTSNISGNMTGVGDIIMSASEAHIGAGGSYSDPWSDLFVNFKFGGTLCATKLYAQDAQIKNQLQAQNGKFFTDDNGAYWTSDIRKKHDFSDITKDIVDKFFEKNYFKHFKWNDTNHDSWGVAAQEFEEWAPEAINTDDDGFKSANYDVAEAKAIAAMTYKIKEQQSVISELKEKLEKLENTLNKLI